MFTVTIVVQMVELSLGRCDNIQQLRVRTKTCGDRRFDKTASTLWNNLPSETRNEQSLEFFKM
jgi:hypothetical protein